MKKIEIKPVFWAVWACMIALGYAEQFFIILLFVTIHEAAHIAAAALFGKKVGRIVISPIGENAYIESFDEMKTWQKLFVIGIGPAVNLIIAALGCFFEAENISRINTAIGLFNIIPLYPLDGGRLIRCIGEYFAGTLNADRISLKMGYAGGIVLCIAGILQIIFFPYNISLLCIGKYIMGETEKEKIRLYFGFFKGIMKKEKMKNIMKIRAYIVDEKTEIKEIIKMLNFEFYCVFRIKGRENGIIGERDIIEYVQEKGLRGRIGDLEKRCHF